MNIHDYNKRTSIELRNDVSAGISMSGTLKAQTTLERCIDQQRKNEEHIANIGSRINQLIDRLIGSYPKARSSSEDEADRAHEGVLGEHALALEYDARRLGEIMADLNALEELL